MEKFILVIGECIRNFTPKMDAEFLKKNSILPATALDGTNYLTQSLIIKPHTGVDNFTTCMQELKEKEYSFKAISSTLLIAAMSCTAVECKFDAEKRDDVEEVIDDDFRYIDEYLIACFDLTTPDKVLLIVPKEYSKEDAAELIKNINGLEVEFTEIGEPFAVWVHENEEA